MSGEGEVRGLVRHRRWRPARAADPGDFLASVAVSKTSAFFLGYAAVDPGAIAVTTIIATITTMAGPSQETAVTNNRVQTIDCCYEPGGNIA